jgi:hypothetical protein
MSEELPRSLTCEAEIERLLRDSAVCDLFGPPPIDLVDHAMAATVAPCVQRRPLAQVQRSTALIVMSLAAAGLFLTTMPVFSEWKKSRNMAPTALAPAPDQSQSEIQAAVVPTEIEPSEARQPAGGQMVQASIMTEQASLTPITRSYRRHARQRAPKAIWTTTVVSESEQGVVLPVVASISNDETEQSEQVQTGVAVVPLQSGLTYTEYTGPGPQ